MTLSASSRRSVWHFAGVLWLLIATLAASKLTASRKPEPLAQPLDTIGHSIAGFSGTDDPPISDRLLSRLLSDGYLSRTYSKSNLELNLFIAFYAQQRSGESMHSPKHCLPGSGWEIWNYDSDIIPVGKHAFKVNKYSISRETSRKLVLYWYQSKGRIVASEYLGKVLLARDALLRNGTSGSIVRLIVPDQPSALREARVFASALIPQVQHCFGE